MSVAVWSFGQAYARGRVEIEDDWETEDVRDATSARLLAKMILATKARY